MWRWQKIRNNIPYKSFVTGAGYAEEREVVADRRQQALVTLVKKRTWIFWKEKYIVTARSQVACAEHPDADWLRAIKLRQKGEAVYIWQYEEEGQSLSKRKSVKNISCRWKVGGTREQAVELSRPPTQAPCIVYPLPHTQVIIIIVHTHKSFNILLWFSFPITQVILSLRSHSSFHLWPIKKKSFHLVRHESARESPTHYDRKLGADFFCNCEIQLPGG